MIQAKFPNRISYVLGEGLIMAVIFKNPETGQADASFASRVAERCMQKGLPVHTVSRSSWDLL